MLILIMLVLSSLLLCIFSWLFLSADKALVAKLASCLREQCIENGKQAQLELKLLANEAERTGTKDDKAVKKKAKELQEKIKTEKANFEKLNAGKLGLIDMIPLAGYRFLQLAKWDSNKAVIKKLYNQCIQYKEKKEAMNYSYYLVASLISSIVLSITVFCILSSLLLVAGFGVKAIIISLCIAIVIVVFGYIPYDSVNSIINDRKEQIERQFPQVVSKLALLTVAGMEVSRAWDMVSGSGKGTLYEEMNRVLIDFANNVDPTEAYSKFIRRCNNNYTTKLATAIIQNLSKGNSEIVALFTDLNREAWLEHKHNARRMGEKISGKLTVPTMLLFLGIILMIIVPVVSGFNF